VLTSILRLFLNVYPNATLDDTVDEYMRVQRENWVAGSGFPNLRGYLNYGHGDEGPAMWFGEENVPRLSKLKKEWDPYRKFGSGFPIPM
jgi:hypothetical protein